jgi:hypothetical protein
VIRSGEHELFDAHMAVAPIRAHFNAVAAALRPFAAAVEQLQAAIVETARRLGAALAPLAELARASEPVRIPERSRGHRARLLAITRRQQRALKQKHGGRP